MNQGLLINDELEIGNEILAYLVENPKAQDTIEGIVEWWLLERKIKFEIAKVKEALSELVAKGLISEKQGSNWKTRYVVNQSMYEEIRKSFKQKDE